MANGPIVVGTDLSSGAAEALQQAGAWARRRGSKLLVVHVAPDEIFKALETPKITDALTERVASLLAPSGVTAEVVLGAGSPHAELVRIAREHDATMVVVGASGTSGLNRVIFGSTAGQVVRYAHCPVLVARPSPEKGLVMAATDFSEAAATAVEAAVKEAALAQLPLRLVHSYYEPVSSLTLLGPVVMGVPAIPDAERAELQRAAQETLKTLLQSTHTSGTTEVVTGPPAAAIVDAARASGASLVVIATHGRSGLSRIALGSVAESVARDAPCSVLAVRRG